MTIENLNLYQTAIGALLKAHGEHVNLNQREIAQVLLVRNTNYISILESGRSNIPQGKMKKIHDAYRMNPIINCIIVKLLNGENWDLFMNLLENNRELFSKPREVIESELDEKFIELLKEYGLGEYAKLYQRQ